MAQPTNPQGVKPGTPSRAEGLPEQSRSQTARLFNKPGLRVTSVPTVQCPDCKWEGPKELLKDGPCCPECGAGVQP